MTPIEQREIRGLTVKQGIIYLFGIISIVAAVALGYANIMTFLKNNKDSNDILKLNIETIRIEQKGLRDNQNTTELRLKVLEVQVQDLLYKIRK